MATGGIYRIRNLIDGKFYIGSTGNFNKRQIDHFGKLNNNKHANKHLQSAWYKYGKDKFIFEVLESFDDPTKEELYDWEQWYLDNTLCLNDKFGYNIAKNAEKSALGVKFSPERCKKISEHRKRYVFPADHRRNLSKSLTGRKMSPESKEKMRLAKLGKKNNHDGIPWTEDSKMKMRRRKKKNSTSKHPGVSWNTKHKKWCTSFMFNGVIYSLGLFNSEEDAALVCKNKFNELIGEINGKTI